MVCTAIVFLHMLDQMLFEILPKLTGGYWKYVIEKIPQFDHISSDINSLTALFGFLGLVAVVFNFGKIVITKSDDPYKALLPLLSCAFLALSAIYLAWGYGLVGIIGLSVHRVMTGLEK